MHRLPQPIARRLTAGAAAQQRVKQLLSNDRRIFLGKNYSEAYRGLCCLDLYGSAQRRWRSYEVVPAQRTEVDGSLDLDTVHGTAQASSGDGNAAAARTGSVTNMLLVRTPSGAAVKIDMPKTTAEAMAMNKTIQTAALAAEESRSRQAPATVVSASLRPRNVEQKLDSDAQGPDGAGSSGGSSSSSSSEGTPRTLWAREGGGVPKQAAVPTTTAEALAMNKSFHERARQNNERALQRERELERERAEQAERSQPHGMRVSSPLLSGSSNGPAPAFERPQQLEMVIKPTARSRPVKIPVPSTTAEAMKMNRAMRSRFREASPTDEHASFGTAAGTASGEISGGSGGGGGGRHRPAGKRSWRRSEYDGHGPKSTADGPKQPMGHLSQRPMAGDGAAGRGRIGQAASGRAQQGEFAWKNSSGPGERVASYDSQIAQLAERLQWSQIIRIWEEIEDREREGDRVTLGPQAYEDVMSALLEHPDSAMVARCTRVFDHLVASGADIRSGIYGLYMKGLSLAKLGARAVALMEQLDRLPGKSFKPNPHFFYNLLTATANDGLVPETKLYYGLMRDMGFVANNRVFHSLVEMYLEAGSIVDALVVFEHAHEAGHKPRDPLANKLTYVCMRNGDPELLHKALDVLNLTGNAVLPLTVQNVLYTATKKRDADLVTKMWTAAQRWGHVFTDADYSFTVQAFMSAGKDEMGLATLVEAYKAGRQLTRKALDFCAQRLASGNNRLDGAYYTLASLKQSGKPVPIEAVNTIIVGCAIRQAVDRCFSTAEALPVVFELQPNIDTYNALMHVLGNMRKQDNDNAALGVGMSLLDKMETDNVKPDQETFMSIIDVVCASEKLTEAVADEVVDRMTKKHGLKLEQDIVDCLASAFEEAGMKEVAEAWAAKIPPLDGSTPVSTEIRRPRVYQNSRYSGSGGRGAFDASRRYNLGDRRYDGGRNNSWKERSRDFRSSRGPPREAGAEAARDDNGPSPASGQGGGWANRYTGR